MVFSLSPVPSPLTPVFVWPLGKMLAPWAKNRCFWRCRWPLGEKTYVHETRSKSRGKFAGNSAGSFANRFEKVGANLTNLTNLTNLANLVLNVSLEICASKRPEIVVPGDVTYLLVASFFC
jgi:hypothetical protein